MAGVATVGKGGGPALRVQLDALHAFMCAGLAEREPTARLLLLGALAGRHVLLFGPPGTAKRQLARRLGRCLADATSCFEGLLTPLSLPEDVFGPLSVTRLECDEYHRLVAGYLPSASVAFLEGITRSRGALVHLLVTLLCERAFDNGGVKLDVPLVTAVATLDDNEDGPERAALVEAFLLRGQVEPVSDRAFPALLEPEAPRAPAAPGSALTLSQLEDLRSRARQLPLHRTVTDLLQAFRRALAVRGQPVSDGRWSEVAWLLRVAAASDGEDAVTLLQSWLSVCCVWDRPADAQGAEQSWGLVIREVLTQESERYRAVATVFEEELTRDQGRAEQAHDANGLALWYDASGAETTEPYEVTGVKTRDGRPLFEPPKHVSKGAEPGLTTEELWEAWFRGQPNGMAKLRAWIENPINRAVRKSARRPVRQPRRYGPEYVRQRRQQVQEAIDELQSFSGELARLRERRRSSWVPEAAQEEVVAAVGIAYEALRETAARLADLLLRIESLPRSDA